MTGGVCLVSQLYDVRMKIEEKIKADGLDATEVRGKIGLRTGKLLALINANTPDDPEVVAKLKTAATELLNITF